jgi:hypothetical protein
MTAKEQAKELYLMFGKVISKPIKSGGYRFGSEQAKQCAIIAVDLKLDGMDDTYGDPVFFWNEVKEEIEKL